MESVAAPTKPSLEQVASRHILMATLGSLGDLHPVLALALELKRRGHRITIATTAFYRDKIEKLGLGFHPLRPDWDPTNHELIRKCEDLKRGPEVLFRELVLPYLKETTYDLIEAASEADLMVASEMVFGAPLLAEKLGLRWVSHILSPCSFVSVHDPSLMVNVPHLYKLRRAGPLVNRTILEFGKIYSRNWWEPVRQLRREMGLRVECDPFFSDKYSPELVLALFSQYLGRPQPDWPKQTIQPGFVFFDRGESGDENATQLREFLSEGEPPIVFTLGSTAVHNPGNFYEASIEAAKLLGRRALLLGSKTISGRISPDVLALPYAPFSQIFPRAAAIVHQGGSGTTGQAMLFGRPQLIVPYGWDQPDNGVRIERLGTGISLARKSYSAQTAAAALKRLLQDGSFSTRVTQIAAKVKEEDALTVACDSIESVIEIGRRP